MPNIDEIDALAQEMARLNGSNSSVLEAQATTVPGHSSEIGKSPESTESVDIEKVPQEFSFEV